MRTIFAILLTLLCIENANAQDTCKVLGQKNPHGLAMEIRGPLTVADTVNFTVESTKPLPYNIGASDTIYFHLCIQAKDGKKHTTQIRYSSTHGAISYTVTMQAPPPASVGTIASGSALRLSAFPNPANGILHFQTANSAAPLELQIFDAKGIFIAKQSVPSNGSLEMNTSMLSVGRYNAVLISEKGTQAASSFIVLR